MALDKKIAAAVRAAVVAEGQPSTVADRLIAWLGSLSDGNESLANLDTTHRFLDDLFETIQADDEVANLE